MNKKNEKIFLHFRIFNNDISLFIRNNFRYSRFYYIDSRNNFSSDFQSEALGKTINCNPCSANSYIWNNINFIHLKIIDCYSFIMNNNLSNSKIQRQFFEVGKKATFVIRFPLKSKAKNIVFNLKTSYIT